MQTNPAVEQNKTLNGPLVREISPVNTIQYKTCNAPYVTRMLFVGAGKRNIAGVNGSVSDQLISNAGGVTLRTFYELFYS